MSSEETPFYVRSNEGECKYLLSLDEALLHFCGPDGYRLTLKAAGIELVIRREDFQDSADLPYEKNAAASLVLRSHDS